MSQIREPDRRIDRYLLGDLPEADRSAIEHDYFADEEMFEQIWAAENDLIDRHVQGRLGPEESTLFERNYLASPLHRTRVALARRMLSETRLRVQDNAEPEAAHRAAAPRSTLMEWLGALIPSLGPRVALVAAFAIFMFACLTWLATDLQRMNRHLGEVESQLAIQRRGQDEIGKQLATERERGGKLSSEMERLRQAIPIASSPPARLGFDRVLSVVLSPVLLRSAGSPQELETTPRTEWVRLEMRLDEDPHSPLQAVVRTVEGKQAWSRESIEPKSGTVIVEIPARTLPAGDYILTLSSGRAEEVNRYYFRIIRR